MRIVIDSNVWISALVFGGNPRRIFEQVVANGWTIVASEEIYTEIRRVLVTKFDNFLEDFDIFQAILRPYIEIIKLGGVKVTLCRDEDDNRVIETATIGNAGYIISGDKDLLVLENFERAEILTPTDFISKKIDR